MLVISSGRLNLQKKLETTFLNILVITTLYQVALTGQERLSG